MQRRYENPPHSSVAVLVRGEHLPSMETVLFIMIKKKTKGWKSRFQEIVSEKQLGDGEWEMHD